MMGPSTRRQLLAGGIGAAAVGLAGVSAGAADGQTAGQQQAGDQGQPLPAWVRDGKLLQELLSSEHLLEYACEQVIGSGKLHQDARDLVLRILAYAEQHVAVLEARLRALHLQHAHPQTSAPFPPPQVAALFKDIKDETQAMQALVQVENLVQSSYFVAAGGFDQASSGLIRMAGQILAAHAQEWTMLEALLHRGDPTHAVPHPFIRGSQHIGKPHKP